jgi:hypothetical protein
MQEDLTSFLLADTALADLLGDGDRLYWNVKEQGKPDPSAVIYLITGLPDYHMAGPSGFVESRVQIDCRGATAADALELARAIEARLSGYRGVQGTTKFKGIFKQSERSRYDAQPAPGVHVQSADFQIFSGLAA